MAKTIVKKRLAGQFHGDVAVIKKELTETIAKRDTSSYVNFFNSILPDPDPILRKKNLSYQTYRELLVDSHLSGVVAQRKSPTLRLEWELVNPGNVPDEIMDTIRICFNNLDLYKIRSEMLDAVLYGFQPLEIMYSLQNGYILPYDIVGKPQEWFAFNNENELVLYMKNYHDIVSIPQFKFLLTQNEASYINPYGRKVLSQVYWPCVFRKGLFKFWVQFIEKFGTPHVIGKLPRSATKEQVNEFLSILILMMQNGVSVIPDDSSVDVKEPTGKGDSSEMYLTFKNAIDEEISKAVLSQTLTTENNGTGSYAASNTHKEVRDEIIEADTKLCENAFNKLIRYICELNFNLKEFPRFRLYKKEEVDATLADRDQKLVAQGVRFTKEYYMKNYNLPEEHFELQQPNEVKQLPETTTSNYSESLQVPEDPKAAEAKLQQKKIDDLISSLNLKKLNSDIIKPLIDLVEKSESFDELSASIIQLYPDMDFDKLETLIANALFVSEMYGRLKNK